MLDRAAVALCVCALVGGEKALRQAWPARQCTLKPRYLE
jgi:hypothetical protein